MNENARVYIYHRREDSFFWLEPIVNGKECGHVLHVSSIEQAEAMDQDLERIVRSVRRKAYRDGVADAQAEMRKTLGLD